LCFISSDAEAYYNPNRCELTPLPEPEKPKAQPYQGANGKPTEDQIRQMLTFFKERPDYSDWIKIAAAVGDALPNVKPIEVLRAWRTEEKPGEYAEKLKHRLRDVHIGTLIQWAKQRGWKNNGDALSYAFVDLQTVTSQAVTWIEEPFLARGELHALMGLGGSYKGTLTLTWAAEFSRRGERVILLSA